jgi:iron(III) transport system substrate-binding protein
MGGRRARIAFVILLGFSFQSMSICAGETEGWKARWEKTLEAASKEGQLTVYGGQEITHPDIVAAFSREFPSIKLVTVGGHGAELAQRVPAERRAGKYLADLYAGGPNTPRTFYLAKFLDPIAPSLILPEVTDTSKWYGARHWYADPEHQYLFMYEGTVTTTGLSYNTKLVSSDEINSYWDLLKAKWKGKLLGMDPRGASLPTPVVILYYKPGVGPEFLRRLYSEMDITLFRDRRQGTNWMAVGKFPVCIFCRDIDQAKKQGLPVEEMGPDQLKEEGSIGGGGSSVLVLFNKAPHPNAARLFVNWYLSRRGQIVWQKVMNTKEIEPSDSMRIDIPKDDVHPEGRRVEGRKYQVIGFLDPEPVQKLTNEVVKKGSRE